MVENLPANAGDMGSSPGLGRSHMPRSNWAREPQLLSLRIWSLCSTTREACAPWWRVAPARRNYRKPSHRNEDPTQPKINKLIKKKYYYDNKEYLNKWNNIPFRWVRRLGKETWYCEDVNFPPIDLWVQCDPNQNPHWLFFFFLVEKLTVDSKVYMKMQSIKNR